MTFNETSRPLKRIKRSTTATTNNNRVTADHYDFLTFPSAADSVNPGEPFRSGVQGFLSRHARVTFPPSLFPWLLTWQMVLRVAGDVDGPDPTVVVDIVEEDVTRSTRSVYCNQCRVVGWSGNPVCRKRYHFIIRADNNSGGAAATAADGYHKTCPRCQNLLHLSESRCKCCNSVITTDDLEDWVYSQFEDNTHLLHGVIHSNGYGHLLTLNGREGGSKVISGCHIINFWDRLCTVLAVRKVTVMDVSRKYGMEYRILHAITHGHSWYGSWGYEFKSGSYALTVDAYQRAVETLSTIPLSPLLFEGRGHRTRLHAIISFYQSLSESELITIKDLFSFMLRLIHETHRFTTTSKRRKTEYGTSNILCAWTRNDVEHVQQAMIKVLAASACWVTRRALKGVMCKAAYPELLDYCMKHFGGKMAANGMVVHARYNTNSSDIEFRLEHLSFNYGAGLESCYPPEDHIKRDLKFLYDSLLQPETMVSYRPQPTRKCVIDSAVKLLDCKQFIKDYKPDERTTTNPFEIHLWCHVELLDQTKDDPIPPEMIVLPLNATIADLKSEAAKAFQEVYAMFKRFEVEKLLEYGSIEDSITLKFLVGSYGSVRVQGRCSAKHGLIRFRMERGIENWTVDCICGAKDDDGERMLACDTCGVWQHTRCAGIDNSDAIPTKYVCLRCINSYRRKSNILPDSDSKEEANRDSLSSKICRGEATDGPGIDPRLTMTFGVR
ncbi:PHD domain-containing protein [Cephalotus follicularis]|uniref:PHD domain-containing protein n=1 Tax=Cephalotus follicularis TaxID=3775 RepID=A0A1Q3BVK7_CEPFO|nr:PHD domain-containing protein [Cephalotus follicularis]